MRLLHRFIRWLGHRRWFAAAGRRFGAPLDRALYRATRGRLTSTAGAAPVMLLTTTGRRSGQRRTTPVMYLRDGDRFVVTSENFGQERPAAWPLNLVADPRATVQVGADVVPCRARLLDDAEADVLLAEDRARCGRRTSPIARAAGSGTPSCWSLSRRDFVTDYRVLGAPTRSTLGPVDASVTGGTGHYRMERAAARAGACPRRAHGGGRARRTRGASGSGSCTRWCARSTAAASERDSLDLAYGDELAEAVRSNAPNVVYERSSAALPIDFRRCRKTGLLRRSRRRAADRALAQRAARDGLHARGGPARSAAAPCTSSTGSTTRRASRAASGGSSASVAGLSTPTTGRATRCGSRRAAAVTARATAHGEYASDWSELGRVVPPVGRKPRRASGRSPRGERVTHASKLDARAARAAAAAPDRTRSRSRRRGGRTSTRARSRPAPDLVLSRTRGRAGGPRPCRRSGRPRATRCAAPPPRSGSRRGR